MSTSRARRTALLVGALAVAAQAIGVRGVLLWDDLPLLKGDDLYTSAARWTESVTTPLGRETFYWRPAATTSFLLDHLVYGAAEWGHRLTSALLHGAVSALAFTLLLRLLKDPMAALFAALVFAFHPVNVEAVTWISARFDLMACLFTLAALAAIPGEVSQRGRWILAAACTLLACCSKENAFLLPALAVAWVEAAGCAGERPRLTAAGWTAAGVAAALFLRFEALGFLLKTRAASVAEAGDALQHALLVGRAMATSILTLVFPWGTVGPAHHAERPIPADDALGWTGLVLAAALVAVTIVALRRRRRTGALLAGFLVSMLPASQVIPLDLAGALHSADRYVYLPSFFAVAAVASAVCDAVAGRPERARAAGFAVSLLLVALCTWRLVLLPRWNDPVRFWRWAVEMAHGSDITHGNLAQAELEAGRLDEAEKHARLAGRLASTVLAAALVRQGRLEDAQRALDDAIADRPGDVAARVQRGEIELSLSRTSNALADFEEVIRIDTASDWQVSDSHLARALAGSAEALAGDPARSGLARERLERAERLGAGDDGYVALRVVTAWIALGDLVRAGAALDRAAAAGAAASDVDALRAEIQRRAQGKGADGR